VYVLAKAPAELLSELTDFKDGKLAYKQTILTPSGFEGFCLPWAGSSFDWADAGPSESIDPRMTNATISIVAIFIGNLSP
jgi:hypothetical protein